MGFQSRTFYVAVCDEDGCGVAYQHFETETDALFDNPDDASVSAELASWGWLRAGKVVRCPEHAPAWMFAQSEALELDATHDPLFPNIEKES